MKRTIFYALLGVILGVVGINALQDWEFWAVMIPIAMMDLCLEWIKR